jgi:hypothetical protein
MPHFWTDATPESAQQGTMRSPARESNMDTSFTVLQATVVEPPHNNITYVVTPVVIHGAVSNSRVARGE